MLKIAAQMVFGREEQIFNDTGPNNSDVHCNADSDCFHSDSDCSNGGSDHGDCTAPIVFPHPPPP